MSLVKSLFSDIDYVGIDNFFKEVFGEYQADMRRHVKDDKSLIVEVDVPGLSAEDLNINIVNTEFNDYLITIKGERKSNNKSLSFTKTFNVSNSYNPDNVNAETKNGVLTLTFAPREVAEKKSKKINVFAK